MCHFQVISLAANRTLNSNCVNSFQFFPLKVTKNQTGISSPNKNPQPVEKPKIHKKRLAFNNKSSFIALLKSCSKTIRKTFRNEYYEKIKILTLFLSNRQKVPYFHTLTHTPKIQIRSENSFNISSHNNNNSYTQFRRNKQNKKKEFLKTKI